MDDDTQKPAVLLVDDEPSVLRALTVVIKHRFDVDSAPSGAEGLEKMRARDYHVVVSDMRMPQMNGAEFLQHARDLRPDTTRLLLTGFTDAEAAMRAVNEGQIFRFLTKPINPPDLVAALNEAVLERQRRRQDRSFIETENQRISKKILNAQRLASVGELAVQSGVELTNLATIHRAMLDAVIAQAESGGVSKADLEDLRWLGESLRKHADGLSSFASVNASDNDSIDLRDLVSRTLESLQATGRFKSVALAVDFEPDVRPIQGNRADLRHAILNVLLNAIDAVSTLEPHERRIKVSVREQGDDVVCCIADNGSGVHPEARPYIFKRYFSTKEGAPGLGLAAAHQILSAHGGTITLESETRDTTFRIQLPAAD